MVATAGAPSHLRERGKSSSKAAKFLVGLWCLAVSTWAAVALGQLRAAKALLERESAVLGRPVSSDDHFSALPELSAAFDTAGLKHHTTPSWTLILALVSVSALALATRTRTEPRNQRRRTLAALATLWLTLVFIAFAYRETLDLVTWLDN